MDLILAVEASTQEEEEKSAKSESSRARGAWKEDSRGRQGMVTGRLPMMLVAGSYEDPLLQPVGAGDTHFYCGFDPIYPKNPELQEKRVWKEWEKEYHLEAHGEAKYGNEFCLAWSRFWHYHGFHLHVDQHAFWVVWDQVKRWYEAGIPAPGLNNEYYEESTKEGENLRRECGTKERKFPALFVDGIDTSAYWDYFWESGVGGQGLGSHWVWWLYTTVLSYEGKNRVSRPGEGGFHLGKMGTVLSWVTPEIPEEEPRLEIPHEERMEEMVLHALSIQLGVTDGRHEKGEFQVIRLLCHALAVVGDFEFY